MLRWLPRGHVAFTPLLPELASEPMSDVRDVPVLTDAPC
ncbi:hypothetical protein MES5069_680079 [Mesorhizobium escarrei]|uniref:Uncharacterized protein n=1 Tax=Mesorhizobium escarrei TaxID=666018 RepID=A0ABM9EHL2_9HYPH|nr:hypothetical protein MES5069_680079 [Mesorhizobium escarrei]